MTRRYSSQMQSDQPLIIQLSDDNPCSPDFDWADVTQYDLGHKLWTDRFGGYEGKASLYAAASPKQLALLFVVDEPDDSWPPRATAQKDGEPVYEDSAVEVFFQPSAAGDDYINIEMNSAGVILTAIGPNRETRTSLESKLRSSLTVHPFSGEQSEFPRGIASSDRRWGIILGIPSDILSCFGLSSGSLFSPEVELKANAYKCGDKTLKPHYHSLFPVMSAAPDYHRPQDFGTVRFL